MNPKEVKRINLYFSKTKRIYDITDIAIIDEIVKKSYCIQMKKNKKERYHIIDGIDMCFYDREDELLDNFILVNNRFILDSDYEYTIEDEFFGVQYFYRLVEEFRKNENSVI